MGSVLPNLKEQHLYSLIPPLVADLDTRGLMQAVLGGFQDRISDLRSYVGRYPDLINPAPEPLVCVLVTYQADPGGNVVPVTLNADDTTPDDPAQLATWAAGQLGVEVSTVVTAVVGTDALRVIGVDTTQLLAQSLGAVLYPGLPGESAADVAARRTQALASYFPRLRLKGTAQSFSIFARLAGFDDGSLIPLWTRLSPRVASDVGAPANDGDFSARADVLPTGQLPDPAGLYDPTDFTDGPFYRWSSGTLSADPASHDFYPSAVNGRSPFINLAALGVVANPPVGVYTLAGGAPGRVASTLLSAGTVNSNLVARALTDGGAFNGIRISVTGTGSYRELDITAQLSITKYRSSYYDTALYRVDAGTRAVGDNADLAARPNLDPDGIAVAPFRPWTGGTAVVPTVTLWPSRSVITSGTVVPRQQAAGTLIEVDVDALQGDAQRVYDLAGEVRAATRFPRRSNVGLMSRDEIRVAAYPCVARLVVPGGTGSYGGIVADVYRPAGRYDATFSVLRPPSLPTSLTVQSTTSGTFSFAGVGISGIYRADDGGWSAQVIAGFSAGTLVGLWSDPDSDTVRTEPSLSAKAAGTVCYVDAPEGTLSTAGWNLGTWDDVPWMRMLRAGGERVDTDRFMPFNGDPDPVMQASWESRVPGAAGVTNRAVVYDLRGVALPPFMRMRPEALTERPVTLTLAGSGSQLYPVVAVSPTTIVAEATWTPGRYDDAVAWWPLNEHPFQPLVPTPALGLTPDTADFSPNDRRWDPQRGWALTLSGAGTVARADIGLPDQYAFALTARMQSGTNLVAGPDAVVVGAARLGFRASTVTLTVQDGPNATSSTSLAMPAGNTLVAVNVGTAQSTLTLGDATGWASTATLSANPPRGAAGVRLSAASVPTQMHDLMVWRSLRSHTQLNALRAPELVPVSVPVQRPYVGAVSGDRWALGILPCAFVVPSGTLATPEIYPAGDVVRYEGTGRYDGNPAYKQVGLGGSQTLPTQLKLGVIGPAIPATGRVVVAGSNGEPGYNVAWGESMGTIYSVTPPYTPTGGTVVGTVIASATWPPAISQYNAATDRVYVEGDNGYAYQLGIDDVGDGPVFVASIPLRPRPPRELPFIAPNLQAGREVVTDFESQEILISGRLGVNSSGTVYSGPSSTGGLLLTEDGSHLMTEDSDFIALEHDLKTVPLYLYLNSRVKTWARNAFTRWVNPTAYGQALGIAALDTAGDLVFENTDPLPRGNYRFSVDVGNIGTVDDQFVGFNVTVTLTTGVAAPTTFSAVLLPDGTGTNPRAWTLTEFTLPYDVVGAWRLTINWTNDRDVPSRGQYRRLAVYAYTMRRIASELHVITLSPLDIVPVDVTAPPLAAGAYVAAFNSFGTVCSYEHEQNLYATTLGSDTFNNPRSPYADVLTGSTLQRRDRLDVTALYQPADPVVPAAPTAGSIVVDPIQAYYNVGDRVTLSNLGATGAGQLRRTWHLWSSGTFSQFGSVIGDAHITTGGSLGISVDVVDPLGRVDRATAVIIANSPPSIQIAAASLASAAAPYSTRLSAVVADTEGDAFAVSWYRLGPPNSLIGSGTVVPSYVVTETQTVRAYAIDVRGGTNFADVPLTASANAAPSTSIVAVSPTQLRSSVVPQALKIAAVARDPEGKGITTEWTFWDGHTDPGATKTMTYFGGGTYCTVERSVVDEPVGSKGFTLRTTNVDGSTTLATGIIEVIENKAPVIVTATVSSPGVKAGVPVSYSAFAYDPYGAPVDYTWEFPTLGLTLPGADVLINTDGYSGKTIGGRLRVSNGFGAETVLDVASVAVFAGGLKPITIDPAGGVTSQGAVVTITSPDSGVTIRYTLDGSAPTSVTDGVEYTGSFMIPYQSGVTTPVTARAFKDTVAPSVLATVTFIFT